MLAVMGFLYYHHDMTVEEEPDMSREENVGGGLERSEKDCLIS